ncbi:MAG: class IIb bacteriocin, lactobin A/cerein 7B family [Shewanella sp.]
MQVSKMEELTMSEIEQVNGGIAPLVGWGIAVGAGLVVGMVSAWMAS